MNKSQSEKSDAENKSDDAMHNSEKTIDNRNDNVCSCEQNLNNNSLCIKCEDQNMPEDNYVVPIVCTEESLVSRYMAHVSQFAKMRERVKAITEK